MATHTPNYNLVKPSDSDLPDQSVLNGNMDKIDTAIKANATNIGLLVSREIVTGNFQSWAEQQTSTKTFFTEDPVTHIPSGFTWAFGIIVIRSTINAYIQLQSHTARTCYCFFNRSNGTWTWRDSSGNLLTTVT